MSPVFLLSRDKARFSVLNRKAARSWENPVIVLYSPASILPAISTSSSSESKAIVEHSIFYFPGVVILSVAVCVNDLYLVFFNSTPSEKSDKVATEINGFIFCMRYF